MRTKFLLYLILAASIGLALVSCASQRPVVYSTPTPVIVKGPPAHAPAHGYRLKHHDGVMLIYDAPTGVYFVQGYPRTYYRNDHFFRCRGQAWEVAVAMKGPWAVTTVDRLPQGLKKMAKEEGKANKAAAKGKGHDKNW